MNTTKPKQVIVDLCTVARQIENNKELTQGLSTEGIDALWKSIAFAFDVSNTLVVIVENNPYAMAREISNNIARELKLVSFTKIQLINDAMAKIFIDIYKEGQ